MWEKQILILDDNFFNIEVLEQIIRSSFPNNFAITSNFSANTILEDLSARLNELWPGDTAFDIGLIDVNMPEMSGFEFGIKLWQLLSENNLADVDLVAVTG